MLDESIPRLKRLFSNAFKLYFTTNLNLSFQKGFTLAVAGEMILTISSNKPANLSI